MPYIFPDTQSYRLNVYANKYQWILDASIMWAMYDVLFETLVQK